VPTEADGILTLLWLIIALPALGAALLLLGGRRTDKIGHLVGTAMSAGAFIVGVATFVALLGHGEEERQVQLTLWTWLDVGDYTVRIGHPV
jgi:NADH-quinone oxidoreductase subunit L